jgi:hypothetical protein
MRSTVLIPSPGEFVRLSRLLTISRLAELQHQGGFLLNAPRQHVSDAPYAVAQVLKVTVEVKGLEGGLPLNHLAPICSDKEFFFIIFRSGCIVEFCDVLIGIKLHALLRALLSFLVGFVVGKIIDTNAATAVLTWRDAIAISSPSQHAALCFPIEVGQRTRDRRHGVNLGIAHDSAPSNLSTSAGNAAIPGPLARTRRLPPLPVITYPVSAFIWLEKLA